MNIVCATDDCFVQHCCIMLTSLLVNNDDVNIYLLTEGLKSENERIIRNEVESKNGIISFCQVDSSIVEKFPMPQKKGLNHISRATYYRLLIAELLPETISKVIYLDCDIIINHSIEDLWNINITDYAIAAVKQIGYGFEAVRLKYPIQYGYFNAGVNVLNLDYFRNNLITNKLIEYVGSHYEDIIYHDQDTLNAVLYDKCYDLLPQWNMTSVIYSYQIKNKGDKLNNVIINDYSREKLNALHYRNDPIILHYVSKPKPWQKNCTHPLYSLYFKYAKYTINYSRLNKQSYMSRLPAILRNMIRERCSAFKQLFFKTDPSIL